MPSAERGLCVVLHDVAPATWPACERLLAAIDAQATVPVTLLVVPEYHRGRPIDAVPRFVGALERRLARGDEIAMHGCFHLDDLPAATPAEWFRRRVLTAGEGEFAALGERSARARLARGLDTFMRLGWPVRGFVPPAWLLGEGARNVLASFPFAYTSSRRCLYALPDWRAHPSASLVWSVRTGVRRIAFELLNRCLLRALHGAPLLRLGIHPVDAAHPAVVDFWLSALRAALATRTPCTKSAWLDAAALRQPVALRAG
ncbi:MAG TPA: polysaccharide deacetylase family protein [Rhodocyclaceae bacterium]